ncbi:MAG: DNA replication/repair protein RecF [Deltaproteobacteria bacterium]|nr:DNA replication/repair protein RecF [Deltaproteobacteria bacterium]
MYIEYLAATNFRNLHSFEISISNDPVLLIGANAQGKTNILEALALCATARSFRNAKIQELIASDAKHASLTARFNRHHVRHDISLNLTGNQKTIRVDGRSLRQITKLLDLVNIVAFFPDDLRIAKGSPEERRRFLDRTIANHRPDFIDAAISYARVLKSRNTLLRSSSFLDKKLLAVYDDQLINYGCIVNSARCETLIALIPLAVFRFAEIMNSKAELSLSLFSGLPISGDYSLAFREALSHSYSQDRARGMTTVGPHRADLRMYIDGRDARQFASQGQQRSIVLSLKLAELEYLKSRLGTTPILLLDDVSSELDSERTLSFFKATASLGSQMWVSTTGAITLPLPESTQRFSVENGSVNRLAISR